MESAYQEAVPGGHRMDHAYGERVHILADPVGLTLLSRLCDPDTRAPVLQRLVEASFRHLLGAAAEQLPRCSARTRTRMPLPGGVFVGSLLDRSAPVVVVDVARGGMIPSYVLQMELLQLLEPEAVRVDHVFMQRVTDASGHVTGVDLSGSKIGGPVEGATLLIPDPMAATGVSMAEVLRLYDEEVEGTARKLVLLHLIVTPEYLRRITQRMPQAEIYALRLDRGLSAPEVLTHRPGERWEEERGLDDRDYIVPGAGGVGELLNNAFV